jgi:hypothetical protein
MLAFSGQWRLGKFIEPGLDKPGVLVDPPDLFWDIGLRGLRGQSERLPGAMRPAGIRGGIVMLRCLADWVGSAVNRELDPGVLLLRHRVGEAGGFGRVRAEWLGVHLGVTSA